MIQPISLKNHYTLHITLYFTNPENPINAIARMPAVLTRISSVALLNHNCLAFVAITISIMLTSIFLK